MLEVGPWCFGLKIVTVAISKLCIVDMRVRVGWIWMNDNAVTLLLLHRAATDPSSAQADTITLSSRDV